MKKFFLLLFFTPSVCLAQKLKVPADPAGGHGILVHDSIHKNLTWDEARAATLPGWRIPTAEELRQIYTKTYDSRLLKSAVPAGTYYTSDYEVSASNDTVRILGLMKGREFKKVLPQDKYYNLLLVKP